MFRLLTVAWVAIIPLMGVTLRAALAVVPSLTTLELIYAILADLPFSHTPYTAKPLFSFSISAILAIPLVPINSSTTEIPLYIRLICDAGPIGETPAWMKG